MLPEGNKRQGSGLQGNGVGYFGKYEKEAQATKDSSMTPSSAIDKGKGAMDDVLHASVTQQVEAMILKKEELLLYLSLKKLIMVKICRHL